MFNIKNINFLKKEDVNPNTVKIICEAAVEGVQRKIINDFSNYSLNAFDYTFAAGEQISFYNNPNFKGNIFATEGFLYEGSVNNFEQNIGEDVKIIDGKGKVKLNYFNDSNISVINTKFNIGVCKGRNILINNIKTRYYIQCDDDFLFNRNTNI